jgi:hypothetical protein
MEKLNYTSSNVVRLSDWGTDGFFIPNDPIFCEWCLTGMDVRTLETTVNSVNYLHRCQCCGYWEVRFRCDNSFTDGTDQRRRYLAYSTVREYEIEGLDPSIGELRRELERRPDLLPKVEAQKFEQLVADVLKDVWSPCEVKLVGGSNDGGTDILLVMGSSTEYMVQVKHRQSSTKGEGPKVIRELNGTLLREGATMGMVVTSAPHFTKNAINETKIKTKPPKGEEYKIKLINGKDFVAMMQNYPRPSAEPTEYTDIYSIGSALYG